MYFLSISIYKYVSINPVINEATEVAGLAIINPALKTKQIKV